MVTTVLLFVPDVSAKGADAGPPSPDGGAAARSVPDAAVAPDAAAAPDAVEATDAAPDLIQDTVVWLEQQIASLTRRLEELRRQLEFVSKLEPSAPMPPQPVAALFAADLADPEAVHRRLAELTLQVAALTHQLRESEARLGAMEPRLKEPVARVARLRRRRRGARIPPALQDKANRSAQRLRLAGLEIDTLRVRLDLVEAMRAYLQQSQPARRASRDRVHAAEELASRERQINEQERRRAQDEQRAAEQARAAALEAQRQARTEAEQLLAAERARLELVRAEQAGLKRRLVQQDATLARLRGQMERFRGTVASRFSELSGDWPRTAPAFDNLYREVVAKLIELRPQARTELLQAIKGMPDVPHPSDALRRRVGELRKNYGSRVTELEQLRARLEKAAAELEQKQQRNASDHLDLLQREITWLNERRLALLRRLTPERRDALTGLTRETLEQLLREVSQLVFDGLNWSFRRLRQVNEVPRLILDVFTVGSLLWKLIKLVVLLLLIRFVLRRWHRWTDLALEQATRTAALGRSVTWVTRLLHLLRHAGPALMVLIATVLIYSILGGDAAASELKVVYIIVFWVAVYRIQLRVVESLARYTALGRLLRIDEEVLAPGDADHGEHEEVVEGAGAGAGAGEGAGDHAVAHVEQAHGAGPAGPGGSPAAVEEMIPASTLLVRSVRAATRYLLAVVLVLDLTALAVGKGTIYGLTTDFSWWAAIPFVIYFLRLWQPHITRAHQQLFVGARKEGTLARLVRRYEGRIYGVAIVGAAFIVVLADRLAGFGRRYLTSLDATKKLLAFLFRRRVEKHAQEQGHVLTRRQDLPREILEQFPLGPLGSRDLSVRPSFMDQIREVYETWQQERSDGSIALVGRSGMGKSTVLQMLEQELETPVLRGEVRSKITRPAKVVSWLAEIFGFGPKPSSERDLVRAIREDARPLVAIDNCHNLFLRQVNGFAGWEAFIRVVNETCDNVFWVLTFNQAAWDYLNNIASRTHYFRRLIQMPPWREEEIRSLIMKRMRRARHGVSFSDLVVTQLQEVSVSAQLGRTSAGYFRLLWDITDGNPRLASHFWLDSLVPDGERRVVRVNLFSTPSIQELEQLPDDVLFVLTAVSEHQNLTAQEAARVTNLSTDYCNFAMKFCIEEGYLERERDSNRARLSNRWQVPVVRFLKRKHLLYG